MSNRPPTEATIRRLERSSGALATRAVARMDDQLPWFRAMPADRRSWVTLVAQAGIASLVEWCRHPERPPRLTGEVFGAAPRELVRVVALKQTVDLIKVTVDVYGHLVPGANKAAVDRLDEQAAPPLEATVEQAEGGRAQPAGRETDRNPTQPPRNLRPAERASGATDFSVTPRKKMVELRGLEPLTPRLPALCSPN